jgi:molecular chaperone DnaK
VAPPEPAAVVAPPDPDAMVPPLPVAVPPPAPPPAPPPPPAGLAQLKAEADRATSIANDFHLMPASVILEIRL